MLKQIAKFRGNEKTLIVCATNHIRQLNPALLRPGRFDYIIPIGPTDEHARKAVFERYLKSLNISKIDIDRVSRESEGFTAADIEAVCAQVAQLAFEKEFSSGKDYKVTTQDISDAISHHRPTLDKKDIEQFRREIREFARCSCCEDCFVSETLPGNIQCDICQVNVSGK